MQTSRMRGGSGMSPPHSQIASSRTNNAAAVARQSSASVAAASNTMTDKERKATNCFQMFTRVLMNYLETFDTAMHIKAKAEIKKYYEQNEAGGPSLKECLRATVGEAYWKIAADNLSVIQQHEKKKKQEQSPAAQPSQDLIQARQMLQRGREEIAKLKASKDEEIAKLRALKDEEIAAKDSALVQDEEELARLKALKDEEIATLNESLKRRESELLKQYMTSKPLVDKVDLTTDDNDDDDAPSSKRRKCIAGILLEETGKKLVKVKQEQVETRADLEDVRDDLDIANETVTQQAVFTDAWQSKFDELAAIAQAQGVDGRAISEIRNRSINNGSS